MSLATHLAPQLLEALAAISVKPNPHAVPGTPAFEKLLDGLAALILLACAVAVLFGIGQWALGSRGNNVGQVDAGRGKVIAGVAGAFGVGALAALINFFYNAGSAVH